MKAFGKKPDGPRLQRLKGSRFWNAVDAVPGKSVEPRLTLPKSMPWPID